MAISTTATTAELVTLHDAILKLQIMLRQVKDGSGSPTNTGRFLNTDIDTQITAVSAAITAATS